MENKDWAIRLIKKLDITSRDNDPYYLYQRIRQLEDYDANSIKVCDGASKMCLVPKDKPFVIKWCSDTHYSEAEDEARIYRKAVEAGLGDFFPKTAILGTFNGISFVVQEKISYSINDMPMKEFRYWEKIGKTVKEKTAIKMNKEFNKASPEFHRYLNRLWANAVISLYGKKVVKRLCCFIIENHINDLHESNIGIKDGKPVILDFSGYHRSSDF